MPNQIPSLQCEKRHIELLAASTQIYSRCNNILLLQTILSIGIAVIGLLVGLLLPEQKAVVSLFAIIALILDKRFLDPWHKSHKNTGAKIQEIFDTELFQLPWNDLKCSDKPLESEISHWTSSYKLKDNTFLNIDKTWYPIQVGRMPLEFARLVCQFSNLRWDGDLRRSYGKLLQDLLGLYCILVVIVSVIAKVSLEWFVLSIFVPTLPLIRQVLENAATQFSWAVKSDAHQAYITQIINSYITSGLKNNDFSDFEARQIQDEIFERRMNSPRVPTWFHKFCRPKYQSNMEVTAESFAERICERYPDAS